MLLDNLYFNKYKILHKSIDFFNKNISKLLWFKTLSSVSSLSRSTQGVRILKPREGDTLASLTCL